MKKDIKRKKKYYLIFDLICIFRRKFLEFLEFFGLACQNKKFFNIYKNYAKKRHEIQKFHFKNVN